MSPTARGPTRSTASTESLERPGGEGKAAGSSSQKETEHGAIATSDTHSKGGRSLPKRKKSGGRYALAAVAITAARPE